MRRLAMAVVCLASMLSSCGLVGTICGGITGLPCGDGQFCLYDVGTCGAADQTGICAPFPELCAEIFAPVCGCDGRTYGNACEAYGAGVSVEREGECESDGEPDICGGIAGFPCPDDEFCKFETGTCGAADQSGVCMAIPDVCTEMVDPVCGCDGETYGNECQAEQVGVSVQDEGECP
jgi:hypothetical protein